MGDVLIGVGGAFLAAGLFARFGRHLGLPTIPFFMVAGILFGPQTPGLVVVEHPEQLELLGALGLILLLFHLGLEFSLDDLVAGGSRLLLAGGAYLALNIGGGWPSVSRSVGGPAKRWSSPARWASRRRRS